MPVEQYPGAAGAGGGGPSDVGASTAANETDGARQKVTAALRVLDTAQVAGSQLVAAKGDQTLGIWVNVKAQPAGGGGGPATIADGADVAQGTTTDLDTANTVIGRLKKLVAQTVGLALDATVAAVRDRLPAALVTGRLDVNVGAGAVTANAGTNLNTSALALAATQTDRTQKSQITDGVRDGTVKAAAVLPVAATDTATVVTLRESLSTPVTNANLDVALSTRLKPADTLAAVTNLVQEGGVAVSLNTGVRDTGTRRVTIATNDNVPVSPVAASVWDVSDRAARLLGVIASITAAVDISDRAARLVGIVYGSLGQLTQKAASTLAVATDISLVVQDSPMDARAATLAVTGTAAAGTGVTVTLPAPAAGLFHYITRINIVKYASVATVGAAAPTVVTSTNLAGSLAWTLPTALAVGTQYETGVEPKSPIKSSVAATATTIVAGALASIIYRITVYYYTAP